MITPERAAKIMDFGLAHRDPQASPTAETGTWDTADPAGLSGTPDYMSPEQARSQSATSASDVFALGLVIYEMLSGEKAIRGDNLLSVLREIDTLDPGRYAAGMPDPFATILRCALSDRPHQRHHHVRHRRAIGVERLRTGDVRVSLSRTFPLFLSASCTPSLAFSPLLSYEEMKRGECRGRRVRKSTRRAGGLRYRRAVRSRLWGRWVWVPPGPHDEYGLHRQAPEMHGRVERGKNLSAVLVGIDIGRKNGDEQCDQPPRRPGVSSRNH